MRALPTGLGIALILLVAHVALPVNGATGAAPSFFVPPYQSSDRADYGGPVSLRFEFLGSTESVGWNGTPVATFGLDRQVDGVLSTAYLSASDLSVVSILRQCWPAGGECTPWHDETWVYHGVPSLFGSSVLQGRTLTIGETFAVDALDCPLCLGTIHVEILPPAEQSPEGTVYVASLTGAYWEGHLGWDLPLGDLHMGRDHPFPLLAVIGTEAFNLEAIQRGGDAISVSARIPIKTGLPHHPFTDGVPFEGAAPPGHTPLATASAAALPPASEGSEPRLLSLEYYPRDKFLLDTPHARVAGVESWEVKKAFADRGALQERLEGRIIEVGPTTIDRWSRTTIPIANEYPSWSCAPSSPPLWDLVARAGATGLIDGYHGFSIMRVPDAPFVSCSGLILIYSGESHTIPGVPDYPEVVEIVVLDLESGLLWHANRWLPDRISD